jgi:hypothetical protein
MRFGCQLDIKGIVARSTDADRSVRYLTKYLTKSVAETYTDEEHPDLEYEAHVDRVHAELRWVPCSPSCANWLRYGVQPKDAGPGLVPGLCRLKAHGPGVPRHRRPPRPGLPPLVRQDVAGAQVRPRRCGSCGAGGGWRRGPRHQPPVRRGTRRRWSAPLRLGAGVGRVRGLLAIVMASVAEQLRWRLQYDNAKRLVASPRDPTRRPDRAAAPVDSCSATTPPRPHHRQPAPVRLAAGQGAAERITQ